MSCGAKTKGLDHMALSLSLCEVRWVGLSHVFFSVRVVRVIFLCPFFCGAPARSHARVASPSYTMVGVPVSGSR